MDRIGARSPLLCSTPMKFEDSLDWQG
jgi:hypothetical protein